MIFWTTCSQCGDAVQGDRTISYSDEGHQEIVNDVFELHICPPEPNLTTMKHIEYKPVPGLLEQIIANEHPQVAYVNWSDKKLTEALPQPSQQE